MAIASRMRHRVTISRWRQGAADDVHHKAVTYVDDPDPTPANVQVLSRMSLSAEVQGPDLSEVAVTDALIFLPIAAGVDGRDRIKGVSPAAIAGIEWQVIGLPRDAGGRGKHLELDARRIRA